MKYCSKFNFNQLADAILRIEKFIGTLENTEENTLISNINNINNTINDLKQNYFKFESDIKQKKYLIKHNLNSMFLNVNVLIYNDLGYWENVICSIKYLDSNTIEIDFATEEKLILLIQKV